MDTTQVVTVRGLRKAYGNRVVVDGLDLDVPAGEIVGLIGANGAGKTTTVECIQGLRKPDAGTLRVLGYDPVTHAEELRPLIGSQLQDSALPDRLRVAEAVGLFSTARARDGDELLERFGLAQRRRSAFASLSGGERQRLFLVLALLNRPLLVILDELTQGLDPAARRNVWAAVRQLHDEGTTVLLVTHEIDEAEVLCVKGSGWAMLIHERVGDRLMVLQVKQHDLQLGAGSTVLLPLDVWEHAYYLKYHNVKADYVKAWWNVVDWSAVDKAFARSRRGERA